MNDRRIVIPGELLTESPQKTGDNVQVRDGKAFSTVLGLYNAANDFVKVVPMSSKYIARRDDLIVGIVEDVRFNGLFLDINSLGWSFISNKELPPRDRFRRGDLVLTKVDSVDAMKSASLIKGSKLFGGILLEVNPSRVPRLIGTRRSMLDVLKDTTDCKVLVGMNGRVWIKGDNQDIVVKAVHMIERESHQSGLTERVKTFLEGEMNGK